MQLFFRFFRAPSHSPPGETPVPTRQFRAFSPDQFPLRIIPGKVGQVKLFIIGESEIAVPQVKDAVFPQCFQRALPYRLRPVRDIKQGAG